MPVRSGILVVDDDDATRSTYRTILRLAGYEVEVAEGGQAALKWLQSKHDEVDLVLMDLRMPDIPGLEVLAEIRAHWEHLPVVVLTAWGTATFEVAARILGAVDFVDKPSVPDDLVAIVERNLERRRSRAAPPSAVEPSPLGHGAIRWTTIVVPVTRLTADVPTEGEWAKVVGKSPSTLKTWCQAAGVHASDSLEFARALRVSRQRGGLPCDWFNDLATVDPRTLKGFLERGRLPDRGRVPPPETFLSRQQFITAPALLLATRVLLDLPE